MTLPVDYASGPDAADRLTAMMIGIGYFVAAGGPFLGGVARDLTGSYRLTFLTMLAVSGLLLAVTVFFRPDQRVI